MIVLVDDVKVHVVFTPVAVYCKDGKDGVRHEIHCCLHRPGTGKNGKTVSEDWVGYGIAKYNPADEKLSEEDPVKYGKLRFNAHKGRKIALNRALNNAGFKDDETRKLFLSKFGESEQSRRNHAMKRVKDQIKPIAYEAVFAY